MSNSFTSLAKGFSMHTNQIDIFQQLISIYNRYRTLVTVVTTGILICIGLGIYLYFSWSQKKQAAYQALSETLIEHDRAYTSPDLWSDVEFGGRTGYRQFTGSVVAPYFIFLQAEALIQIGKLAEALEAMKQGIEKLPKKSPLYDYFALKVARLKMSMADQSMQNEGLQEIETIARDEQVLARDKALYILAEYYEQQGDVQKSIDTWQRLADIEQKGMVSPWILSAREKVTKVARE